MIDRTKPRRLSRLEKPFFDEIQDSAAPQDSAKVHRWLIQLRTRGISTQTLTYRVRRGL